MCQAEQPNSSKAFTSCLQDNSIHSRQAAQWISFISLISFHQLLPQILSYLPTWSARTWQHRDAQAIFPSSWPTLQKDHKWFLDVREVCCVYRVSVVVCELRFCFERSSYFVSPVNYENSVRCLCCRRPWGVTGRTRVMCGQTRRATTSVTRASSLCRRVTVTLGYTIWNWWVKFINTAAASDWLRRALLLFYMRSTDIVCGQNVELLNVKLAVHIVTTGL